MLRSHQPRLAILLFSGISFLACGAWPASAQQPDNTAVNKSDRTVNADQAKNDAADRELMKHIRRDVVKDKSLSTYAHNVKIVAEGGKVTLLGPVRSEQEKKAIEEHAAKYAGAANVTNELTVKGS